VKKESAQGVALKRIRVLFGQAFLRPSYAKRYVSLARKISTRYKVRIPAEWRRRFCKNCNALLIPGRNCRVRKQKSRMIVRCLECGGIRRIGLR
jgi:ribonuclease P protein subunit RPR2